MDDDSSDRVGIVGLGRLGLCQALTLERAGYDVLGCDVFPAYVDSINNKTLQSDEPGVVSLLRASTKLRATLSLEAVVDHSDLLMVVVATPTGIGEHAYDCGTLSRVLEDIGKLGRRDKHVVICCTVLPGYIAQVASSLLEGCAGCTISYNPEFIAQDLPRYVIRDVAFKPRCPVAIIEESQPLEVRRTYGNLFDYEIDDAGTSGHGLAEPACPNVDMGNPGSSYRR